jgi:hypothetical protein
MADGRLERQEIATLVSIVVRVHSLLSEHERSLLVRALRALLSEGDGHFPSTQGGGPDNSEAGPAARANDTPALDAPSEPLTSGFQNAYCAGMASYDPLSHNRPV